MIKFQLPKGLSTNLPKEYVSHQGMLIYATDTEQVFVANGTEFVPIDSNVGGTMDYGNTHPHILTVNQVATEGGINIQNSGDAGTNIIDTGITGIDIASSYLLSLTNAGNGGITLQDLGTGGIKLVAYCITLTGLVTPGILYSEQYAPLPDPRTIKKGTQAVVSDAKNPTYMGLYVGDGDMTCNVICDGICWYTH